MPALVAALLIVAVPSIAAGERESWHDDTGPDQGVGFTRDITHTHVPSFFDARAATFTCGDGQSFDDPLVVIAAGDGSSELNLPIASDGSFSYSGPAAYNNGSGSMQLQGRFSGTTATGTVHWTATRDGCSADSGTAAWTAHCSEQCGGASGGGITVSTSGKPVVGQYALVDVHVQADGAGRLAAFAHHHGAEACGTFAEEQGKAVRNGRPGAIEGLGEAQVPAAGPYTFHSKYIPDQFGHADRICAYLTQAPEGSTVLASGEGTPKIGFALPWTGTWGGPSETGGLYSLGTPDKENTGAHGTAPGFWVLGSWACDGRHGTDKLTGRRWWLRGRSLSPALRAMPVTPRADGSFSYSGRAIPDFSNNYEPPISKKWPSHTMTVSLTGRFKAGRTPNDRVGGIVGGAARLVVRDGGRTCTTKPKLKGEGVVSELPAATEQRYGGTLTSSRAGFSTTST